MRHPSLDAFLSDGRHALAKGPVALIFAEDLVEVDSTIRHHFNAGFREILLFAPAELRLSRLLEEQLHRIDLHVTATAQLVDAVNRVIAAARGIWLYYCYNAEYLFYPFCETRSVAEMLAFHTEERRDAMLTYVIDLYAGDLARHPNAVALEEAFLDRTGYYALAREGESGPKERQLDFYGGLRWRFEEHVPKERRKIDRIALFRAVEGLELRPDHTFNIEEYNTYACPWHNNITAAICSFRTAKALKTNAGSSFDIRSFMWHNSVPFEWSSRQLMNLGLMEPGQWF
ncbi:MAG: hypothetical protein D6811_00270 [Alphaproteobacteria bacterium]|nr:MAG: hypothetical protein D6811_00270 [Alphaproteobacteria bacterium]